MFPVLSVAYAGLKGAYKKLGPLSNFNSGFPAVINGNTQTPLSADPSNPEAPAATFSFTNSDVPFIAIRVARPTRKLIVQILDASNQDAELGVMAGGIQTYISRNDDTPANMATMFQWNGQYVPQQPDSSNSNLLGPDPGQNAVAIDVPDKGTYKIRVMALYPFGDVTKADSYETWTSPAIGVNRSQQSSSSKKVSLDDILKGLKMNKWLLHALQLDQGSLDGVSSPQEILDARRRKVDLSPNPVKVVLPKVSS